jgi:hypothetical protein
LRCVTNELISFRKAARAASVAASIVTDRSAPISEAATHRRLAGFVEGDFTAQAGKRRVPGVGGCQRTLHQVADGAVALGVARAIALSRDSSRATSSTLRTVMLASRASRRRIDVEQGLLGRGLAQRVAIGDQADAGGEVVRGGRHVVVGPHLEADFEHVGERAAGVVTEVSPTSVVVHVRCVSGCVTVRGTPTTISGEASTTAGS